MEKQKTATRGTGLNPKDFLRARRPEQFSDSVKLHESAIDRSVLRNQIRTDFSLAELANKGLKLKFLASII